jgi:acetyl-CoA C-acetyltransferase
MGSKNPNAHFRNKISVAQVLQAGPVAEPLGVFDCAPLSDGAAAVVLGPLETARKHTDTPIRIAASQVACDSMALQHRKEITSLGATVAAGRNAFRQAGRTPKEVQVAEIHDAYTISGLIALEDLGFSEKGRAGPEFESGRYGPGGAPVVNPSGGLKAQGQPFGAVGVAQVVEIVRQLRGQAGDRQVPNAQVGLAQNLGGTGATAVVHLLERVN